MWKWMSGEKKKNKKSKNILASVESENAMNLIWKLGEAR